MRNFKLFAKLALGVGLAAAVAASCRKSDEFVHRADVPFSMKVTETRQSHEFIWLYDGNALTCPDQALQELWVTFWNTCILEAFSDESGFEGVNFSSSHPELIRIEAIDDYSCKLVYVADSPSDLPVTITARTDNINHSFVLYSKNIIPLEGLCIDINGQEYIIEDMGEDSGSKQTLIEPVLTDIRKYEGDLLTIVGLVPENASFRYVKRFTSSPLTKVTKEDKYGAWPRDEEGIKDVDWSEIQGRQAWLPGQAAHYFLKLQIETHSRVPDKKKPSPRLWMSYFIGTHFQTND